MLKRSATPGTKEAHTPLPCIVCFTDLSPWQAFGPLHVDTPEGKMCYEHLDLHLNIPASENDE